MKHDRTLHLEDSFGIGQQAVARIRMETAEDGMARAARVLLDTRYTTPEWLAMQARLYRKFRADYDTAQFVATMEAVR